MANTTKVTKAMVFSAIVKALSDTDVEVDGITSDTMVQAINHEIELLEKKKSGTSKTAMKNAETRSALGEIVLSVLANAEKPMTVTEMQNADSALRTTETGELISTQRVTSVCYSLCESGKLVNTKEKKKSYFSIAE